MNTKGIIESSRLLSVDVFRGFTMAAMVLVENPGTWPIYRQLRHAEWGDPITFKDWIFPFFLFIMGVSITLSLTKRLKAGLSRSKLFQKTVSRTIMLFSLGMLLHLFYFAFFGRFRIPGILQRIAIVYFVCAVLYLLTSWRTQIGIIVAILLGYWILLTVVPVPGVGPANLNPDTNLAAWLDQTILDGFLRNPKSDPQGILSTLPAICIGLIGLLAGQLLQKDINPGKKTLGFAGAGIGLVLMGWLWGLKLPILRDIWTSSYVLYTSGFTLLAWSLCYWLFDVRGFKRWAKPFAAYGASCIFVFLASHVVGALLYIIRIPTETAKTVSLQRVIVDNLFLSWLNPQNASALYAFGVVLLWLIPLWILYNKQIYIKI
jgi:predicted acyltransferase